MEYAEQTWFPKVQNTCFLFFFHEPVRKGHPRKSVVSNYPLFCDLNLTWRAACFLSSSISKNLPGREVHWALLSKGRPFQSQTWHINRLHLCISSIWIQRQAFGINKNCPFPLTHVFPHDGTCFNSSIFSMRPPSPFTKILGVEGVLGGSSRAPIKQGRPIHMCIYQYINILIY